MPLAFLWYVSAIPENSKQLLQAGIGTIGSGLFTQVTRALLVTVMTSATILAIAYFLAWRNPKDFGIGHAIAVLLLAFAATGAGEHAREMIRKPFTIGRYMYSNGVRKSQIGGFNQTGYTTGSPWNSAMGRGELMFRGQCMNCHTVDGYRSMRRLLNGRDRKSIGNMLSILHENADTSPYRSFMPPLVGSKEEIDALGDHLNQLIRLGPP
jgi:mono/diheme cytochrome c family protein